MKYKITFILSFVFFVSFAQFKVKTEYNYLKFINFQQDKKLIKSSCPNAELVANRLFFDKPSKLNTLFFNELSTSEDFAENKSKSLFYHISQRILFPNDSISNTIKKNFYDNAYKLNFNKIEVDNFWNKTTQNSLPKTKNKQIELVLNLGTKIHSKHLTKTLFKLGSQLEKKNYPMPQWYKDWKFLTIIQLKEKKKISYLDYQSDSSLFNRLNRKKKIKIYNQAINYHIKKHAFKEAKRLTVNYKKEHLPLTRKTGLLIKKLVTLYHKII